jgi:hypothetical protein
MYDSMSKTLLPGPAGPASAALIDYLRGGEEPPPHPDLAADVLADRDAQLSLYLAYELHYRGFPGPVDREWDPPLLAFRGALEAAFLDAVTAAAGGPPEAAAPEGVGAALFELAGADDGPSIGRRLYEQGTLEQFREFVIHRSAYQLKEADPHSWAIPRLHGPAKAAMLEVQFDEYGSGDPERMHSRLFADAMEALGLDSAYGAYIDLLPAETLATVNLMSVFGLHRRWRGAIVGHLATFEISSPGPNRLYARALRRLGAEEATDFFDEHVEADSIHENIAAYDMAQALALAEPGLAGDILFGARALLALDALWAERLIAAWDSGATALVQRDPTAA